MKKKSTSPVPHKGTAQQMSFTEAIKQIVAGQKVTRLEWGSNDEYGFLSQDGYLSIFREGKENRWLVNDGDMTSMDWYVLPE